MINNIANALRNLVTLREKLIELDFTEAWRRRRETMVTAGFALVVPFVFGIGGALLMFGWSDIWAGASGQRWQVVLGIGMACAVTAVPVLILLMDKLGILRQPIGDGESGVYPAAASAGDATIIAWTSGPAGQTKLRTERLAF